MEFAPRRGRQERGQATALFPLSAGQQHRDDAEMPLTIAHASVNGGAHLLILKARSYWINKNGARLTFA
jgi:hypothetical protein